MGSCTSKKEDYVSQIIYCPKQHALKYKTRINVNPTCSECFKHLKNEALICEQCSYKLCNDCVKKRR